VVYDLEGKTVRHFVDGRRVASLPIVKPIVLDLGGAQLGDWNGKRSLSGAIDELVIYDHALTDAKVSELHEAGKP